MGLLEELQVMDVDLEGALHRLRGNKELYKELVLGIPEDISDYDIENCFEQDDYKQAALNAHALKGEMANLGINPLYKWYSEINTLLKQDNPDEAKKVYSEGIDVLNKFLECIEKYQ